jgi:hypothetical protein
MGMKPAADITISPSRVQAAVAALDTLRADTTSVLAFTSKVALMSLPGRRSSPRKIYIQ